MRIRIGVLTFHRTFNYGGVLQAFALCSFLKSYDVKCVDYIEPNIAQHCGHPVYASYKSLLENIKHFVKYYICRHGYKKERKLGDFISKNMPLTDLQYLSFNELQRDGDNFEILISGSDQIWNPQLTGNKIDPAYFLKFSSRAKKISYASSAGSYRFNDKELGILKDLLADFSAISVRESQLKHQISHFKNDVEVVLDPTFLLDVKSWRQISVPISGVCDKYVLLYTFDNCRNTVEVAQHISDKLGAKVVGIGSSFFREKGVDLKFPDAGIEEFLWLFENAEFVVTNSFHGTVFALIFRKNFFSVLKEKNPYRVSNLLSSIDLISRLINNRKDIDNIDLIVDYSVAGRLLFELQNNSRKFLEDAINK